MRTCHGKYASPMMILLPHSEVCCNSSALEITFCIKIVHVFIVPMYQGIKQLRKEESQTCIGWVTSERTTHCTEGTRNARIIHIKYNYNFLTMKLSQIVGIYMK